MGCVASSNKGPQAGNALPAASTEPICEVCLPEAPPARQTSFSLSLFPKSMTSIKGVRTALDSPLNPQEALTELQKGNKRFLSGKKYHGSFNDSIRKCLAVDGQSPMATIIGCADSRVPVEIIFDTQPGDLFILRNAGNTCLCAEGSLVGSAEYAVGHLQAPLILVMGHTKCGALTGATHLACGPKFNDSDTASQASDTSARTMLQSLLLSLEVPVKEAEQMLPPSASLDEIAALAIRCNVFHTMKSLVKFSEMVRERLNDGRVQIQGAVYDINTGIVEFLGSLPKSEPEAVVAAVSFSRRSIFSEAEV